MLDAVLPIVVLVFLLALTIAFFGVEATDGPLQVALLLSAAFASLVAFKNGYTVATVADAAVGGVSSAMGAIFILLAVGALIGTWNMAGTIPTLVDYGLRLVSPAWFYVTAAIVCALVGLVTGSSWTTVGTLGVAFVGIATVMGLSTAVAAGAVICGAYFGDKMTPLSETTILVPRLVGRGLTTGTHIRSMFWTAGPALALSLVVFFVLGAQADPEGGIATDEARAVLGTAFNVGFLALLPLVLLVAFAALRLPPFLAILGSALFAGLLAPFIQPRAVEAFVEEPDGGAVAVGVEALFAAMASGFVSHSGVEAVDELFSRGGMSSMLTTVWLILGALSFAAVMEHAGFLQRLLAPIVTRARSRGSLIAVDDRERDRAQRRRRDQYVADVLPGPDVPGRVRAARPRSRGAVAHRRGRRHGDLGPGPVEHLRRLHLRRPRRLHGRVPALLHLQHRQPRAQRDLRIRRVQDAERPRRT